MWLATLAAQAQLDRQAPPVSKASKGQPARRARQDRKATLVQQARLAIKAKSDRQARRDRKASKALPDLLVLLVLKV